MGISIGIPSPTTHDLAYNRTCWPEYARAVEGAGATVRALELTAAPEAFAASLTLLDGFVLPGSPADVEPVGYGQAKHRATAAPDPAREACDRAILVHAAETGKPVLAICFGAQMLNVWRGGSLVQDLAPLPVNHSAGPQVAVAHSVLVEQDSLLASLLTSLEAPAEPGGRRLRVNSSHHQALDVLGDGLTVVARSVEDGIVEAVEGRVGAAAMLGVQWHPERSVAISAASRALFQWLVLEAEDQRGHVTLEGTLAQ